MKTQLLKTFPANIPALLAFLFLLFFSGVGNHENAETESAKNCCSGYKISMANLRQFMLDSLASGEFEGGVYSKADLLKAIHNISGDSVYMMNGLLNCLIGDGNGMFITSPTTGKVEIVSKNPYCSPCPGKACCPQHICAAKIMRSCINYKHYDAENDIANK